MPINTLFLAMDNFFRQVVNFSEQSLVRKVVVAYFATITERQIALPWRLRHYLTAYIPPGPREGWTKIRSRWVDTYRTTPKVCAWISQPAQRPMRIQSVCGYIPEFTPMPMLIFKRNACGSYWHTCIIHTIADKMVFRWWEFVQIWDPQKFFVSLCSDWEPAYRKRHVQLYSPEMERCSRTDASPDIAQRKEKEVPQERPEHNSRHHYEEPAVECGRNRNGLIR